jgi:acyl carrier protein
MNRCPWLLLVVILGCAKTPPPADKPTGNVSTRIERPKSTESTESRVETIVAEQLGLSRKTVNATTTLASMGADDLDLVELVMELEEEFDVSIPDEAIAPKKNADSLKGMQEALSKITVGDLTRIVKECKAKTGANP